MSRTYCHLCEEMAVALQAVLAESGAHLDITVEVRDVDADPVLEEKYDEKVPVLLLEDEELCHYFLDDVKVRAVLTQIG